MYKMLYHFFRNCVLNINNCVYYLTNVCIKCKEICTCFLKMYVEFTQLCMVEYIELCILFENCVL